MPVLVPIVEGQSEERAIGGFLRRLLHDRGRFDVQVARPLRVKRHRVVREGELEKVLHLAARTRPGASEILVILDADDDCPVDLGRTLGERSDEAIDLPVGVVLPKFELEAWILAGIESVRGRCGIADLATPPDDPEGVRDAKGALTDRMTGSRGYVATADQPRLLEALDVELAVGRSRSLRKLVTEVDRLFAASGA